MTIRKYLHILITPFNAGKTEFEDHKGYLFVKKVDNEKRSISFAFYVGDKYKLIREIKTHLPQHIVKFVEPFVGGGSVFLNIDADESFLNDINGFVVYIHKMLCTYAGREEEFFNEFFQLVDYYYLSLSYRENTISQELKAAYPKTYFAKYNKAAYSELKKDFNQGGKQNFMPLYALLIYGFNCILRFNKKGNFNLPVGDVDFSKNTYVALKTTLRLWSRRM